MPYDFRSDLCKIVGNIIKPDCFNVMFYDKTADFILYD